MMYCDDCEDDKPDNLPDDQKKRIFGTREVRLAFIRKVYATLVFQLIVTALVMMAILYIPSAKEYFNFHWTYIILSVFLNITLFVILFCCTEARRTFPFNFIFLILFTLTEGFLLGLISCSFEIIEVLIAIGAAIVICFAVTMFAFQTTIDFTAYRGIMMVFVLVLVLFTLIYLFLPEEEPINIIISACFVLVFVIYLIIDTQMMIAGTHMYGIRPNDYIFAALCLYLDVVLIFLFLLTLVGSIKSGRRIKK